MYLSMNDSGITIGMLSEFSGGTICGTTNTELAAYGISVDSRTVKKGDAFLALIGERFDGHDFLEAAAKAGAPFAIVSHAPAHSPIPYILVKDTTKALGDIARGYKRLFRTISVAVTGSVGKTTTKQFIYSVLETKYKTNETKGNHNNEIGLPLTLLDLTAVHKALVVEMGMNHKGEIAELSSIAEPDIAVITGIGTAHMENFGSKEAIRDAKMEIVKGMKGGILILNGDDPMLADVKADGACVFTVGIENSNCIYSAGNIRIYDEHMVFDVRLHDGDILKDIRINMIGRHNIYNALFACACGIILGVPEEKIRFGLLGFSPAEMRQHIEERNGITVIEDCYNANPESMAAGLDVLCHTARKKNLRPVAVLGSMLELGAITKDAHFDLGNRAASLGVARLVTFGKEAREIAKGAIAAGMSEDCITVIEDTDDAEAAANIIKHIIGKGDAVLFKASRAMALERITRLI